MWGGNKFEQLFDKNEAKVVVFVRSFCFILSATNKLSSKLVEKGSRYEKPDGSPPLAFRLYSCCTP